MTPPTFPLPVLLRAWRHTEEDTDCPACGAQMRVYVTHPRQGERSLACRRGHRAVYSGDEFLRWIKRECVVDGCHATVGDRRMCWGHVKQRYRGREIAPLRKYAKGGPR